MWEGIRWRGSLAIDIELETGVDGGRRACRVKWADGKSERKKTNRKQLIRRRRRRQRAAVGKRWTEATGALPTKGMSVD